MLVPPAEAAVAITPSDSTDLVTPVRALVIGATGGNVAVVSQRGGAAVTVPVAANSILPLRAVRVNATNTTATPIVGLI